MVFYLWQLLFPSNLDFCGLVVKLLNYPDIINVKLIFPISLFTNFFASYLREWV